MKNCRQLVLAGNYNFVPHWELCAGRKKKFKSERKFQKTPQGKYVFVENMRNYFGLNKDGKYRKNFYLSGTDSCRGDSGGALYHWQEQTVPLQVQDSHVTASSLMS